MKKVRGSIDLPREASKERDQRNPGVMAGLVYLRARRFSQVMRAECAFWAGCNLRNRV